MRSALFALAAALLAWPGISRAQTDVRAVPTYESVGLYWSSPGADPQTGCAVRYRRLDESTWHAGLDLWFDPNANECRGSVVRLAAGTAYRAELSLPGQPAARTIDFTTWANRKPVARTITVASGSATLDVTQGGSPSGYVVYQAAPGAVLDAGNASLFNITVNASYVVIRGFTLRGAGQDAIRLAPDVTDVIIEDNDISGWGRQRSGDLGMDLDAAVRAICTSNALERITIQRNRIHDPRYGANSWSQGHPAGPQGITFSHCGGNHVIRHNEIWSSAGHYYNDVIGGEDNISTAGFPNYDSDIYGNKLSNSWDDGIEAEGGDRNVRVWGNYIDSTTTGIATALASVGPFYAFRNVYNRNRELDNVPLDSDLRQEIFKTASDPSFADGRRYFFHNTTLQAVDPSATKTLGVQYGISGAGADQPFNNAVSRNNIFHTWDDSQPVHRQVGTGNEFTSDMYNGVANVPITNGIHAAPAYAPGNGWQSGDGGMYALQAGTPGYDAGVLIPNFNDDYLGAGPDVGAAEAGAPPMRFGLAASPGPAVPPPQGTRKTRVDFDGDGQGDLLFYNSSDNSVQAWLMDYAGGAITVKSQPIVAGPSTLTGTWKAGDFDGDGTTDLVAETSDGATTIYLMRGGAVSTQQQIRAPGSGWHVTHVADFDNDGRADILWRHDDGRVEMWLMNGTSAVGAATTLMPAGTAWRVASTSDFNGDGRADLVWVNDADGSVGLWLMSGATRLDHATLIGPGTGWVPAFLADFNDDGNADIVWRNPDGSVGVWTMQGLQVVSRTALMGAGTGWRPVLAKDFNDAIYWKSDDGSVGLWIGNGSSFTRYPLMGPGSAWTPSALQDMNGANGDVGLLWTSSSGSVGMWHMAGGTVVNRANLLPPGTPWRLILEEAAPGSP